MKAKDFIDKIFQERCKMKFKSWLLGRLIDDLSYSLESERLTPAQVEEAKLLLEIYERD